MSAPETLAQRCGIALEHHELLHREGLLPQQVRAPSYDELFGRYSRPAEQLSAEPLLAGVAAAIGGQRAS